jgi:DNA-binding MurR/RpiR family transcriptional regulator
MQASLSSCRSRGRPTDPRRRLATSTQLELTERIRLTLPELSAQFQAIGNYCLSNLACLHRMRIEDVSEHCGARPSTIVRFAKLFGLKGYKELKVAFLDEGRTEAIDEPRSHRQHAATGDASALRQAQDILILGDAATSPLASYLECSLRSLGKHVSMQLDLETGTATSASAHDLVISTVLFQDAESSGDAIRQALKDDIPVIFISKDQTPKPTVPSGIEQQRILKTSSLRSLARAIATAQSLVRTLERQLNR